MKANKIAQKSSPTSNRFAPTMVKRFFQFLYFYLFSRCSLGTTSLHVQGSSTDIDTYFLPTRWRLNANNSEILVVGRPKRKSCWGIIELLFDRPPNSNCNFTCACTTSNHIFCHQRLWCSQPAYKRNSFIYDLVIYFLIIKTLRMACDRLRIHLSFN